MKTRINPQRAAGTPETAPPISRKRTQRRQARGLALVIVLSALVLMAVLTVAFFTSVSTERTAAKSYSQSGDARRLADSALNLVVAQIKDASTGVEQSSGLPAAWVSQPGLIRTFNPDGTAGSAFKLYSAPSLRDSSGTFDPAGADQPPATWYKMPALYTDLNAPVFVPDSAGPATINGAKYAANYPIVDPAALSSNADSIGVKGFSIDSAPLEAGTANANPNPVPMPVQWLYVLENGEIVAATGSGANPGTTVTLTGITATAKNPIVGRIAFWTDDESCKVNINTAAGDLWNNTTDPGSFTDTPAAGQPFEGVLRANQPAQHEYQRYPGHPATTYLSAVFPDLLSTRKAILDMAPRITSNGTTSATISSDVSSQGGTVALFTGVTPKFDSAVAPTDGNHLYASVDELQFRVTAPPPGTLPDKPRLTNPLTPQQVQQAKFFLTAQSRAPDVNLFGKPRVGMWPQIVGSTGQLSGTPLDKTIAFCSTIGSGTSAKAYYFTRNNAASQFYDFYGSNDPASPGTAMKRNREIYAYLQNLTSRDIPGFGGNFLAKYPSPAGGTASERDQILTELFDYVRSCVNLVDTNASTPYAGVKSAANSRTNPAGTGNVIPIKIEPVAGVPTMGFGRSQTLYSATLVFTGLDTGVYNPTTGAKQASASGSTNAYKNKLITSKVQALFILNSFGVGQGVVRNIPNLVYEVSGLDALTLNGQNLGFPASGAVAFNRMAPNFEYATGGFSGADNLYFQPGSNTPRTYGPSTLTATGPSDPTKYPFIGTPLALPQLTSVPGVTGAEYKQPLALVGGTLTMKIYAKDKSGNVDTAHPIQTFELLVPSTNVPTPATSAGVFNWNGPVLTSSPSYTGITTAAQAGYLLKNPDANLVNFNLGVGSTVPESSRGLVPMGAKVRGDLRLIAAKPAVSVNAFVPADGYYKVSQTRTPTSTNVWGYNYDGAIWSQLSARPHSQTDGMMAGADRDNAGGGLLGAGYPGSLVSGVTYNICEGALAFVTGGTAAFYPDPDQTRPQPMKMPDGTTPLTNEALLTATDGSYKPGDWDTGVAGLDGPYINKTDEGEIGPQAYGGYDANMSIGTLFSPNRQIPSPVMFGSLSSGVARDRPWQTLLFCPNPPAKNLHPGFGVSVNGVAGQLAHPPFSTPPDHLLLDLFTMPVVEPYAISEPFSTAGKVNMNYQIAPFTYIKRSTGLQAVLRSTRISAIPTADGQAYRNGLAANINPNPYRLNIDVERTLVAFDDRFANNLPFRSPSEICQMFLVPAAPFPGPAPTFNATTASEVATGMTTFWNGYKLTGDNLREKPYAQIYSRLTTKSNSYTVHVRVQSLKKRPFDPKQNEWVEGKDQVVGEYRGSFTIERFIDPNDPDLLTKFDETYFGPDQVGANGALTKTGRLDPFYRSRTVITKQFAP